MDLKSMKIREILPDGKNIIEHSVRIKLGLTCDEYCVFDTILSRKKRNKTTKFADIENFSGLSPEIINLSILKMSQMLLLKINNNEFFLNKTMIDEAFKPLDDKLEDEFEKFWKIEKDGKLTNCWAGPRTAALIKFKVARKKFSFEFIMQQRSDYFKLLEHQTYRQVMQATKFLNIKTGQIEEDFKSQWPDHFKEQSKTETKILTKTEKDNLYK